MSDSEVRANAFAVEVVRPRTSAETDQGDMPQPPDDLTRDEFDEWYADALVQASGEVVSVKDLYQAFKASLDPALLRHFPFGRVLFRLRESGLVGRLEPGAPLVVANVAFDRKRLELGDDGIFREAE